MGKVLLNEGVQAQHRQAAVVIPLSKAILAVMALYYAVGQWNSYFNAMIFIQDEEISLAPWSLRMGADVSVH